MVNYILHVQQYDENDELLQMFIFRKQIKGMEQQLPNITMNTKKTVVKKEKHHRYFISETSIIGLKVS